MIQPRPTQRVSLPDVTLLAATSIALDATVGALTESLERATFARAVLLSDRRPPRRLHPSIEWRRIAPLHSRTDYSRFMLHQLHQHVETSHALCVQWDGYVLDASAWSSDFLKYDYVGAVWPHFRDANKVGNGGFSLRSRSLLRATAKLPFDERYAEDVLICRVFRAQLEEQGLRFAPEEVAQTFAYERAAPSKQEFGFHGAFNLVRLVSLKDAFKIFCALEPQVLSRNEHKELLHWAVCNGYCRFALLIISRIVRKKLLR